MSETTAESGSSERLHAADAWTPAEGVLERTCRLLCAISLVVMVVMTGAEVVSRALFHFSFEVTDEIGGYLLVAISFLSLPVCQASQGFHHVEFIQARLSLRGRAVSRLVFDLTCLLGVAILVWQLGRLVVTTWQSEDVAATILATPLWIPELSMPLGSAVLSLSLLRAVIGDVRRLRAVGRIPIVR